MSAWGLKRPGRSVVGEKACKGRRHRLASRSFKTGCLQVCVCGNPGWTSGHVACIVASLSPHGKFGDSSAPCHCTF